MNEFENNGYMKGTFLSEDLAIMSCKYGEMDIKRYPPEEIDEQSPNSHYKYGDPFMEMLLVLMLPKVEELTELELLPTYSYYRIYYPGDDLEIHTDRPSCEISATICLGYNYKDMPEDYNWPIWVKTKSKADVPFDLKAGEGVVYKGCDVEHWRDIFVAPVGSWHQQVFLHYVDKNGPYTDRIFDGRPGLGHASKERWEAYRTPEGQLRYL